MSTPPPEAPRAFAAPDGAAWEARVVASGRTSPYLAAKLTRPLVEFRCVGAPRVAVRYAPLGGAALADLADGALLALWRRSRPY
ncbi:MAG TPA: hypothetical protein VMD31_05875 [Opitutaceae bacterium]|nr:hypothetical protein [Opitutaceae bacterium]